MYIGGGNSASKTCSGRFKILLNNCLSDVEHRLAKSSRHHAAAQSEFYLPYIV